MNIYLIGFMGCGKTSVGEILAKKLGYTFIDTDQHIENKYNETVSSIFSREGESKFREYEKEALIDLKKIDNSIIATGGGMPCSDANIKTIKESGISIYLKLDSKSLVNRVSNSSQPRPLTIGKSKEQLLDLFIELLAVREPYYNQADIIVNVIGLKMKEVMAKIDSYMQK